MWRHVRAGIHRIAQSATQLRSFGARLSQLLPQRLRLPLEKLALASKVAVGRLQAEPALPADGHHSRGRHAHAIADGALPGGLPALDERRRDRQAPAVARVHSLRCHGGLCCRSGVRARCRNGRLWRAAARSDSLGGGVKRVDVQR